RWRGPQGRVASELPSPYGSWLSMTVCRYAQQCTPFVGLLAIGLRLDKHDFPKVVGSNARVGGRESPVMFRGDASSAHLSATSRIMNGVEKEDRHAYDSSGRAPASKIKKRQLRR